MIDFKLDPTSRDMVFSTSSNGATLAFLDGAERVAQSVGIRLRTWRGEWFLDVEHGVPYIDEVMGKNRSNAVIASILRAEILDVHSVRRIDSFSVEISAASRTANVSFSATSDEGVVSGAVLV